MRIGVHFDSLSCQILQKIMYAPSVRLRAVFYLSDLTCFAACLTLDRLAPAQSKRSFSILALPSTMCNVGTPFVTFWRHLGIICHAWKICKSKDRKRQEMSLNLGFKTGHQKVVFWLFLVSGCEGAPGWPQGLHLVPQGGPKDPPRALKVSPKIQKWSPTAIPNQQKSVKRIRELVLKNVWQGGKT